jgi:hypothetical protein
MSTVIYYECRDPRHLAAPSRYGVGGIVFRHGTAAYCDGVGVDAQHHWVATGGVPIETLFHARGASEVWEASDDSARPGPGHVSNEEWGADPLPHRA